MLPFIAPRPWQRSIRTCQNRAQARPPPRAGFFNTKMLELLPRLNRKLFPISCLPLVTSS